MESQSQLWGVITEVLTWVGLVPGIMLILVAWIIRTSRLGWTATHAVVFVNGDGIGYRWHDHNYEVREALFSFREGKDLVPGTEFTIYFSRRNPVEYSLTEPVPPAHALRILGWILTGVGALSAVVGFVLIFV
ncbi:hypothetical protein [Arthrobacter sp. H20]|uniref:hypothetical protein n=1 Tax=Arthrobacter sp. H20 TaxID=1267981 RepID=UPI0004AD9969|nr:hypothetical protein [Arthrobacter sp. H20]